MKSPIFKDNIEDKEIKFMLPKDKDIVVNHALSENKEDINGR